MSAIFAGSLTVSFFHLVFYCLVVGSLRALLTLGARVKLVIFHEPPRGAFVMASNHTSHFDPPFLSGWLPRKIDWIAMSELFSTGWSKTGFHWLDVIPVDRGGDDRHALREALRRLSVGRVIGVFPEGGIRDGARSMLAGAPVRDGAVMLAVRAGCPIVPVVILGSERLYNAKNWVPWRRARVFIAVGAPVHVPEQKSRGAAREQMRADLAAAIVRLKDDLVAKCGLGENDLPHSPRERMSEA
ncbi:MAG: lysophospholipid acyltransferase family protein [Terrimicrobiaceae bacterium]|nr:1-acyl-sn-glycerol-3-phosphate acyltransferase [Terrimicrobiaceae bacterium]